ncbi:hypothetical protein [Rodentibacter caecimuris]|uniref:Putative cytidine deaminase C-terminal domain-containing protein n=1 Tax=Rodentibacter caecimuris TaxID=1796644 RepID=A0ABX3KYA0_9PAST|nr:hypothetical protein BKG89_05320 [Rodentibacter heylii]
MSDFVEQENAKTRAELPQSLHYGTLALGEAEAVGLGGIALKDKLPKLSFSSKDKNYPKTGMDNHQRGKVGDSDYPSGAENNETAIPLKQQLSNEMLKAQGVKFENIDVIAKVDINGKIYVDTNQRARSDKFADPNKPTLIAENVAQKPPLPNGKPYPNSNMENSHAEVGAIQQAYERGGTKGKDMVIQVQGKDVCTYCRQDIALAAEKAGLKSVTIHAIDKETKLPKVYTWSVGQKVIKEKKNGK